MREFTSHRLCDARRLCRYIVRCLCRIVYSAKEAIVPVVVSVLEQVRQVLAKITKDPRQPTYNHYVFECLAAMVRNVCGTNPAAVADFEVALFPAFNVRLASVPLGTAEWKRSQCAHSVSSLWRVCRLSWRRTSWSSSRMCSRSWHSSSA